MSTVEKGTKVKVHYVGTLDDGTQFDNSKKRGNTLDFQVGAGMMIKGFDDAVTGMGEGEVKTITISSQEAYGDVEKDAFTDFPRTRFGEDLDLEVGGIVQGAGPQGEPIMARISSLDEDTVTLDFNHPLAGKDLTFEIELIEIEG